MSDIYIIVEGQTEQTFVRDVLAPQMSTKGIYLFPSLIGKSGHKGGNIRLDRAKTDIRNFLNQRKDTYITTMFDYFRIPSEWPGIDKIKGLKEQGKSLTAIEKGEIIEVATHNEIIETYPEYDPENRFIPYIEMHEFEALLFSDADILASKIGTDVSDINAILNQYSTPEDINNDSLKAPSKRLEKLKQGYRKVAMGKVISEAIGIETIREKCPHFNNWLKKLESL